MLPGGSGGHHRRSEEAADQRWMESSLDKPVDWVRSILGMGTKKGEKKELENSELCGG
jgi:hypothetical protein